LSSAITPKVHAKSAAKCMRRGRTKLSSLRSPPKSKNSLPRAPKLASLRAFLKQGLKRSRPPTEQRFRCGRVGSSSWHARCYAQQDDSVKCVLTDPRLPSPAPEILDYLARQPEAQDTIEGILQWWVLDSCIRSWAPKIAKTVAKLVTQGFLEEKQSSDGRIFYHVSPRYLSTLRQPPPVNRNP
jgi:hypothetical protein